MSDAHGLPPLAVLGLLHLAVLAVPGSNVLLVTQLAASGNRRAACFAGLGISLVACAWASCAILGVHAALLALPRVRVGLQWAGGLYLCHLAARIWRSNGSAQAMTPAAMPPLAALRMGVLTNLANPKSALFFAGVFASALPPHPSPALSSAAVALVLANALAWHLLLALAFSHPSARARYARWRVPVARGAGLLLAAFGLQLLSRR